MSIYPASMLIYEQGSLRQVEGVLPVEEEITLAVNGQDLVGLRCTPILLEELALGFLYNEGLIEGIEDVVSVRVCGSRRCVDVWLYRDVGIPVMRTLTTGCGGGTTFQDWKEAHPPLESDLIVTPAQVIRLMRRLQDAAVLHRQARGVHASALAEGETLLQVAEDVGRHNTVDKLAGLCLRQGQSLRDRILLTTGRISSEMLVKAARMGIPVVVSLSSPTSLSVEMARLWNIALIGYARGNRFHVYTSPHRLSLPHPDVQGEKTDEQ
ncbi:MAG: formate dehydrogenase accessory sulfurtransferase FdhD [Anaerolineae bacterium]|nr:formate dehydrogenase accessory sulfurtransferase FdhD [Anaerolineae bacterium]MDW8067330.1 formate dehydrogenase accessory sulfurtransferase FdhD [Anaerolineae bacterium]